MDTQKSLLSLNKVSFRYEAHLPMVLCDITLEVPQGSFVAVVGPSGSGKSTILRLAIGLEKPASGHVENTAKTRMVFQSGALLPWRTAIDNVKLGLTGLTLSDEEGTRRAQDALELVGIKDFAKAYPRDLSGGQRQRVGIARALVSEPTLLLLDEPFSALDVETAEHLSEELLRIREKKEITMLMISHSIEDAVVLADEVLVCAKGVIVKKIPITLARPRNRRDDAVQQFVHEVRTAIPGFQS